MTHAQRVDAPRALPGGSFDGLALTLGALARGVLAHGAPVRGVLALSALALSVLALGGCSGRDVVALDGALTPDTPSSEEPALPPAPPDTAAGRQLSWVIEAVNERGHALPADEIEEHFGAVFIRVMTTESIQNEFATIAREAAPLEFLEISPDTDESSLLALIDGSNGQLTIGMNIERETGKIAIIQFSRLLDLAPAP